MLNLLKNNQNLDISIVKNDTDGVTTHKTNGLVIKQSCTYISKVKHHKCIKCKITNSTCNCTIISLNSIKLVVFSRFIKFQRNMVFLLNESSPRIYFQSKNIVRIATQTVAVPGRTPRPIRSFRCRLPARLKE